MVNESARSRDEILFGNIVNKALTINANHEPVLRAWCDGSGGKGKPKKKGRRSCDAPAKNKEEGRRIGGAPGT